MRPINNTGYLMQRLSFLLARQSDQILQEQLGIGHSQFKILMVLGWDPNIGQKCIADKLGQTEAAISRQIKLLKELGMLTSEINQTNRREHITVLTAKGQRLTEKALEVLNSYHAPMFELLSDKQNERLHESLSIMHEYVCRNEKPGIKHGLE
ncbi:MAG: MarR family winged helix-turn-helix transcriptional regulator [Candidatus Saccharibacteria bacterium]